MGATPKTLSCRPWPSRVSGNTRRGRMRITIYCRAWFFRQSVSMTGVEEMPVVSFGEQ